ncbi:MAG: response regulator [Ardenticatenaceae bacterium]
MSHQIRVVVADAHPLIRVGVEQMLETEADMSLLGEAVSLSQAINICQSLEAHILLLASNLPDYDPVESVLRVRRKCPGTNVLILTFDDNQARVRAALNAGAAGYVLKHERTDTILRVMRTIAKGTPWTTQAWPGVSATQA